MGFHAPESPIVLGITRKNIDRHSINRWRKSIVEDDFTRYDLLSLFEREKDEGLFFIRDICVPSIVHPISSFNAISENSLSRLNL